MAIVGTRGRDARLLLVSVAGLLAVQAALHAQAGRGPIGPPPSPKAAAPIDMTGYWVSVVTEDWRYRMVTPAKGDYLSVPINAESKRVADAWDPAKDEAAGEQCKSYGAAGIMRLPERVHVTWQDDNTMRMDIDSGTQTRLFHFGGWKAPDSASTWQGDSVAQWEFQPPPPNTMGQPQPAAGPPKSGSLKVTTTHMRAGYLRKNGVPYSENAVLTEYYDVIREHDGNLWMILTSVVRDPLYLQQPFILSTHFKKESDGSKWDPYALLGQMVIDIMLHARIHGTVMVFALIGGAVPAFAQIDLSGSWVARNQEDVMGRMQGPYSVDYTGLPLNQWGLARALSYSQSQLSMPERECAFYPPTYLMLGPFSLKIWNETEPLNGKTIAWHIGGWEDKAPQIIWMDGRPHPSKYAPHERGGFTTGVWEGEVLTTYTTHMKAGYIRRNGAPTSDQATMTNHLLRHDDLLTVTGLIEDPIYLTEPYYLTRTFQLNLAAPLDSMGPPCVQGDEGIKEGEVPHYLPGKNPFVDELTKDYHIPAEAVMGGAETMYPEYRKKLKDKYVAPEKCLRNCGGPAGGGRGGAPPPGRN